MCWDPTYWGDNVGARVRLERAGRVVYAGRPAKLFFKREALHQVFVETVERTIGGKTARCSAPFMVHSETMRGFCGIESFTKEKLTCTPLSGREVDQEVASLLRLGPPTLRGFGLEYETVFRKPSPVMEGERSLFRERKVEKRKKVKECFRRVLGGLAPTAGAGPRPCTGHGDCVLAEFCEEAAAEEPAPSSAGHVGVCVPRENCSDSFGGSGGGGCPTPLSAWRWEVDGSVHTLDMKYYHEYVRVLGVDLQDELDGVPMEAASPGPPGVLSGSHGLRSAVELLAAMRHMGVQAGPSAGLHVHVNVANPNVSGGVLTPLGVAAVWVAWAQYQLVIDEFMTPGRLVVKYARPLFLGHCGPSRLASNRYVQEDCAFLRRIFNNIHRALRDPLVTQEAPGEYRSTPLIAFCNEALRSKDDREIEACFLGGDTSGSRYWEVNLQAIGKHGTLEFRPHAATHDSERVLRWLRFVLAFVEHFGKGDGLRRIEAQFLSAASPDKDFAELRRAQREASSAELFQELRSWLGGEDDTAAYYSERRWERGDVACDVHKGFLASESSRCTPGMDGFFEAFSLSALETLWSR